MKLKGINVLERHVEKLVVLIVCAAFLLVTAMQFVGRGNTVDVGSQRGVAVDKAYEALGMEASARLGQLRDPNPDQRIPDAQPDLIIKDVERRMASIGPTEPLPFPLGLPPVGLPRGGGVATTGATQVNVRQMAVPTPSRVRAGAYAAAVDPMEVLSRPELLAIAPDEQPYDMRAVTVAAEFNAKQLIDGLRAASTGALAPIPEPWWRGRIEILDVQLERREVGADGSLGAARQVAPMPGRFSLRDRVSSVVEVTELAGMVSQARTNAREVVQPMFYNVIAGERWAPPKAGATDTPGRTADAERDRLIRQLESVRRQKKQAEDALAAPRAQAEDSRELMRSAFAQAIGGGGGGGGGSARDSGESLDQLQQRQRQQREARIRAQIDRLIAQESTLVARLREMGFSPDSVGPAAAQAQAFTPPESSRLTEADELTLWAQDLDVEPGARYQYRVRVGVNNPLFGYAENLTPETRSAADDPVIFSEWSTWSEPVEIDRDVYWYVTRAVEGGEQTIGRTPATSTVEVYRFFYGYWRKDEARLRPGDMIAAVIDLETQTLPMFDFERTDAGGVRLLGANPLTGTLLADTGGVLMDVRPAAFQPARGRALQVVVMEFDGVLVTRQPGVDQADRRRQRLDENASAGIVAIVTAPGVSTAPAPGQSVQPDARDERGPSEPVDDRRRPAGGSLGG